MKKNVIKEYRTQLDQQQFVFKVIEIFSKLMKIESPSTEKKLLHQLQHMNVIS